MKFKLFRNGIIPVRKHQQDAGVDIYLPDDIAIEPGEIKTLGLAVGVQIPHGYVGQLVPRSSTAKMGFYVFSPYIDEGYTGELFLVCTNVSKETLKFKRNDRVCSLGVYAISDDREVEIVDEFPQTERGDGAFGSTGK